MTDFAEIQRFTRAAHSGWRERLGRSKQMVLPLAGGLGLLGWGLFRRGWLGTLSAVGGGYLALESVNRIRPYHRGIYVSQTVNKPVSEVYKFARNPENWAYILEKIGERTESHLFSSKAALNRRANFRPPQIWKEEPDQVIAWQSRGRQVHRRGAMRFRPAPGKRGTEVLLGVEYRSAAPLAMRVLGLLSGDDPEQRAREALRAMKQLLETGEIPTTKGQPNGRRGLKGRVMERLLREPVSRPPRTLAA